MARVAHVAHVAWHRAETCGLKRNDVEVAARTVRGKELLGAVQALRRELVVGERAEQLADLKARRGHTIGLQTCMQTPLSIR